MAGTASAFSRIVYCGGTAASWLGLQARFLFAFLVLRDLREKAAKAQLPMCAQLRARFDSSRSSWQLGVGPSMAPHDDDPLTGNGLAVRAMPRGTLGYDDEWGRHDSDSLSLIQSFQRHARFLFVLDLVVVNLSLSALAVVACA